MLFAEMRSPFEKGRLLLPLGIQNAKNQRWALPTRLETWAWRRLTSQLVELAYRAPLDSKQKSQQPWGPPNGVIRPIRRFPYTGALC